MPTKMTHADYRKLLDQALACTAHENQERLRLLGVLSDEFNKLPDVGAELLEYIEFKIRENERYYEEYKRRLYMHSTEEVKYFNQEQKHKYAAIVYEFKELLNKLKELQYVR